MQAGASPPPPNLPATRTPATPAKAEQSEPQGNSGSAVDALKGTTTVRYILAGAAFLYSLGLAWHLVCYLVDGFTGMLGDIDNAKLWAAAPWILVGKALVVGAVLTFCGALLRFAERMTVPLWIEIKRQQDATDEKRNGLALSAEDVKKVVLGLLGKGAAKSDDKG